MKNVLSDSDILKFIDDGFILIPNVFSPDVARHAVDHIWQGLPEARDDPATWTQPRRLFRHSIRDQVYESLYTDKLKACLDALLLPDRWRDAGLCEWHQVGFPGHATGDWQTPDGGWHVDGAWFQHYLDGVYQALVLLPIWTDVEAGGGATAIKPGSHVHGIRHCAAAGAVGLSPEDITRLTTDSCREMEAVDTPAQAGDVVLMHHYTLHAGSLNRRDTVRMITNMYVHLKARPCFDRDDGAYSPFELAVRAALTME